jgi:hypothetical protein
MKRKNGKVYRQVTCLVCNKRALSGLQGMIADLSGFPEGGMGVKFDLCADCWGSARSGMNTAHGAVIVREAIGSMIRLLVRLVELDA